MKVVTSEEMKTIDRETIEGKGIPAEVLMGYAGKSVADYVLAGFNSSLGRGVCKVSKIAVFSGTGNNGGDGFVAAYFLSNKGLSIDLYIVGDEKKISDVSKIYLNVCRNCKINIIPFDEKEICADLDKYDLIIDALLGTGFKGTPRGKIKDAISKINSCKSKVLSVDLPSGLPSDGEAPEGEVIKADCTVTIGLPKISLVTHPGKRYTGRLSISEIGFPDHLVNSTKLSIDLLDADYVKSHLDYSADADSHKGSAGYTLLTGGFDNMEGSIMMAAMAAFEAGVGLATLLTTYKARKIIAGKIPELITRTIESFSSDGKGKKDNIEQDIKTFFKEEGRFKTLIIGPGMGRSESSRLVFNAIINNMTHYGIKKVLIDGDGLYHLAEYLNTGRLPEDVFFVLTPHFNEASRLIDKPVDEIKNNRIFFAKELARKSSSVVLLKGPSTIVSDGKNSLINTTGNPALGTAGSGDVLSGIIGGLLLKNISVLDAAGIGAYIHGLAADMYLEESRSPVLKATDIIKYIRKAVAKVLA